MARLFEVLIEILTKDLAVFVKILSERFLFFIEKMGRILTKLLADIVALVAFLVASIVDFLSKLSELLARQFVANDHDVKTATSEMANRLGQALYADQVVLLATIFFSVLLVTIFVASPLVWRFLSRRALAIFISFNRPRENNAELLQSSFENDGARVLRIPFREAATHQDIVTQATEGIKRCDVVVCLPGATQSYVEHEVLAATVSNKPIVFLLSEKNGTLPNTADKRYPIFRLEIAVEKRFKPVVDFVSHVGSDFKSTAKLCWYVLNYPLVYVSLRSALVLLSLAVVVLWIYCLSTAIMWGNNLVREVPTFATIEAPVVLAQVVVLGLLGSLALLSFLYSLLFAIRLYLQLRARRRARLKTLAAQFSRDDWVGIMPDLSPGGNIYDCLFETAPSAHHEVEGKRAGL